jgi:hypothetical protein
MLRICKYVGVYARRHDEAAGWGHREMNCARIPSDLNPTPSESDTRFAQYVKMRDCEFTYVSPFRVDPFRRAWLKLDRKRSAHYQAFRLQTAIHGATKGAEAVLGGV